jgi:Flp pilus assembly protein TadG
MKLAHFWGRSLADQRGNALVEMAVVLPIFLMIFFGISQYAIVLLTYCNATYSCRMAARYASMHSGSSLAPDTVSQLQGFVTSKLFLKPAITPTVSVNYYTQSGSPSTNTVGNTVRVAVTWNQTLNLALMNSNTFTISTADYKVITR